MCRRASANGILAATASLRSSKVSIATSPARRAEVRPLTSARSICLVCAAARRASISTDRLSDEAEKFITENSDRPFFLYLPEFAVHLPLEGKKDLVAKYTAKLAGAESQNNPVYAAMVESVDQGVGRLMRKFDELGIAGNTL